jgi:histidine transport system substrate-binding protein
VAKEGSTLQTTPEGLKGKIVGVQQGTSQDFYLTKYFKDSVIKRYKTLDAAQNDLVNKRVEIVFADGVTVTDGFLKKPTGKGFAQVGADVASSADKAILGDGTGFAVRKEDTELLAHLNKAFDAIRANGKYKTIADKYFNFDIYGQ